MKIAGYLFLAALAIAVASGSASAQTVPPAGRMYVYHSLPTYPCPGLDWLLVAGENGSITGMGAWDQMRGMAKATGTIKDGQVNLTAASDDGRTATMTGTVGADGLLLLNITTPNVKCEGVKVPFYVAP